MARRYAAILAMLGMTIVFLRACKQGDSIEASSVSALFWMAVLGTIGMFVGNIARTTVDEAVRQKIEQELTQVAVSDQRSAVS